MKKTSLMTALNSREDLACRMALNFEIPQDGSAPEWIEILPAGQIITGRDGRTWINDQTESLLAAFAAEGKDLPIDWEHSSELKAREGEEAPASGWIKQLEIREGGSVWARVEWTARGAASISSKEYRYLSPVFVFDMESRRIVRITSCGLTNQPNLYLEALNKEGNHTHDKKEHTMELAQLLAALGLPATTTFAAALNHIATMRTEHETALNQAKNPSLDLFVPRKDYDTALNRATTAEAGLKAIKDDQLETAINTEIEAALKAGKITPGTKDYHVAQCKQEGGLDRFKAFVGAAPVIASNSELDSKELSTGTALNAEDLLMCERMGLTVEEYKKANNIK